MQDKLLVIMLILSNHALAETQLTAAEPTSSLSESPGAAIAAYPPEVNLGVRLDCLHDFNENKGASQACITVTGLRFGVSQRLNPQLKARIRLDPFGTLDAGREDTPDRSDNLPSIASGQFLIIDDYGLVWTPRPHLDVGVESYDGATRMPRVTGLAFENPFDDPGWRQTALTVTYKLAALSDMRVRVAVGNGEGENGKNYDPQQYFGFDLSASILPGLGIRFGVSQDPNSLGSEQYDWLEERFRTNCGVDRSGDKPRLGYATQRMGGSLTLDGSLALLSGFKLSLAGQTITQSDSDKTRTAYLQRSDYENCSQIEVDYLFVETPAGQEANTVKKSVYGLGMALTVLKDYVVAGSYTMRAIDTGRVKLFETCSIYNGTMCLTPAEQRQSHNKMTEDAMSFGAGFQAAPGLKLMVEYVRMTYDRKYAKIFFHDQNNKTSDIHELFNARVTYDWR